jgi:hypothetical protein
MRKKVKKTEKKENLEKILKDYKKFLNNLKDRQKQLIIEEILKN